MVVPGRKKFDATLESSLALAAKLAALPSGTAVEAQDTLHRVTLVSPVDTQEAPTMTLIQPFYVTGTANVDSVQKLLAYHLLHSQHV